MKTENTPPIERAVAMVDGVANLACACGVSAQAIYKWLKKGYPPVSRCESIEKAVGGRITKFELLPPEFRATQAMRIKAARRPS